MRIIIARSIEKKGEGLGIGCEEIVDFIQTHRKNGLEELCSPLPDTTVFKGYINRLQRIIIFAVTKIGVIYPVYLGDKHDNIAKNITVQQVRKNAEIWQKNIEKDISQRHIKIRHFDLK
ncbi:MAG: hypothetical protein CO170_00740 [candidate division SR1 bacterium CG_4_9_14_3_um_filter_40_9]|nr:MAG: hypothetical protein CO170_00740 [candidate division SR1 bacterium CG_4_9_14_3_um_filter_40_9]